MRKGIKVVMGMLAGLFILGAGMQVEAGFNLGKAFGNVGVKANVPAAKDSVPTVGNSGVGMTIRASCDLPYANIYGGSAMRVRIEGNTIILSGSDVHMYGRTNESGAMDTEVPGSVVNCVIWKSKEDHYFTFTKPAPGEPVKLVRHEGGAAGIKFED